MHIGTLDSSLLIHHFLKEEIFLNSITIPSLSKCHNSFPAKQWFGLTATTYYHQWNTTTLDIYGLFGKLIYSKEIPKKTENVELDVSLWHAGMYVARLVFMNEVVAVAKFVIQ